MASLAPHREFAPPQTAGTLRALGLAILAHGVLLVVLTLGVQWKSDPVQQTFVAELWSTVPVEAAAPAPLPTPEPEPVPEPPKPVPVPPVIEPAPVRPAPRAEAIVKAEAEIALAKEKQKQKDKERAQELKDKKLALEKQALEDKKQALLDKQKQDKLKKELADKQDRNKEDQRKQDQKEAQQVAEQRQKAIKRMEGLAGAGGSGAANSSATAAQSAGPSASYAGRIAASIKPNITYPDNVSGNPRAEVEIRAASNGLILSTRITQSSGIKSWDEAVVRAIEKTERLPKDTDGSVQTLIVMGFRPKD